MRFNPYFVGSAFLVIIGVLMLVTARYLWSLPFFGGAIAMYFLAKSDETEGGSR